MEMIVAVANNGVIGDTETNKLLWNIPEDLSRFYRLTKNNVVIMGNKTYRSLPNGKLKNRINIVLTRSPTVFNEEDDLFFVEFSQLQDLINRFVDKKVFVIGGSSVYHLFFPLCTVIHYTLVNIEPAGNVEFPFSRDYIAQKSNIVENEWNISISGLQYKYITYYIKS
jgi:dihydrofolate reductase